MLAISGAKSLRPSRLAVGIPEANSQTGRCRRKTSLRNWNDRLPRISAIVSARGGNPAIRSNISLLYARAFSDTLLLLLLLLATLHPPSPPLPLSPPPPPPRPYFRVAPPFAAFRKGGNSLSPRIRDLNARTNCVDLCSFHENEGKRNRQSFADPVDAHTRDTRVYTHAHARTQIIPRASFAKGTNSLPLSLRFRREERKRER